jgi:hypothetical protein
MTATTVSTTAADCTEAERSPTDAVEGKRKTPRRKHDTACTRLNRDTDIKSVIRCGPHRTEYIAEATGSRLNGSNATARYQEL